MVGYDNLILGPGIPGAGGRDGILAGDARFNVSESVEVSEKSEVEDEKVDSGTEEETVGGTKEEARIVLKV